MAVRMIAVDMDGTFLDENKQYNVQRFSRQYALLKQKGIHFVVASGNQYYQLQRYFPDIKNDIAFVAENGAWVSEGDDEIFCGELAKKSVHRVLDILAKEPDISTVVCGRNGAYVHSSMPDSVMQMLNNHYYRLEKRDNLYDIDDTIFKFSLNLANEGIDSLMDRLHNQLGEIDHIMHPVSSGYGFIDLIIPGCHKAHGIALLQQKWGISDCEVVAIGDSANDLEMLRQACFSFAMANAVESVSAVARFKTESNQDEGALNVIARVLAREFPFD
ncbi:sugar phosphatase [Pantoea ananatis]|uniref:Cof-type HAD-IIB family hydrolase n=1 Tax=Pantoea ananas TaxID=553 RepID=UPI0007363D6D|nr:Cof-type HAD-IIB family hydrolase [Pantoea ananatis]KTR47810.1 sugar phosphatase [Pantoea ananatis]KTR55597.1 sugar phosphatase [Pantoea ananatis]KTR64084.1 sugar phosphatase [Pantoea ananatis]KTR70223.1 sugar phosphatase [Pantoea ananatis]MDS7722298.1 Cof-type HAD-IIB family hydrolase [Pantoea ananatis]